MILLCNLTSPEGKSAVGIKIDVDKMIELLGGVAETARLWEVTTSAVSQWRKSGAPGDFLKFLRIARPRIYRQVATKEGDK